MKDIPTQELIDKFTKEYGAGINYWNWLIISIYQSLSEDFIREFKDKVHWNNISAYQKLSENFIREFQDKLNWTSVSVYQKLSEDFIREFKDKVSWDHISINQKLSEDFINEFKDEINIRYLATHNPDCPPGIKIRYMKENDIIKKQDPETHEIEYEEKNTKKDNSLEELKQLISINLNEKITIAQINNRDKETQELVDRFTEDYGTGLNNWNWYWISVGKLTENFIREFKDYLDWENISRTKTLSEDFIREFQDSVLWNYISVHQKLSENFIREFKDKVNWNLLSLHQKLSEDFINEFKDKIDMEYLTRYNPNCPPDIKIRWMKEHGLIKKQDPETHDFEYHEEVEKPKNNSLEELKKLISINLNEKVIMAQVDNIDKETQDLVDKFTRKYGHIRKWHWGYISQIEKLTENFIREFKDKVNWSSYRTYWQNISAYQKLTENFIREFKEDVSWNAISLQQKLSENFIREFKYNVNWLYISSYQKLSENFIREFKDKVNWSYISSEQMLSEDFIEEFKDKIDMRAFVQSNPSCPPDLRIRYMKEHDIIKKQDPETHEIEYHEEVEKPIKPNNSLEDLKNLISINLNEKIVIAQSRDKETQELVDKFTRIFGENPDGWNWDYISFNEALSENFIREFKYQVKWVDISYKQKLSEGFIREFKDYVDWQYISFSQVLSEGFTREFKDDIDWSVFAKYNHSCPPDFVIKYMKENDIIKKQDPETHDFEYHEEPKVPKNNSLEELKKLISINLNEKIRIEGQDEQNKEDICMPKITKIAQHIHKDDYPSIEDIASYTEAIKLFKQKGKISDPELEILIDNLPSPQNIRKSLSNNEIKIIFRTIWYLWHKITGINLIEDTKVEQKKETLEGNYWMVHKGVLMSGPNHYTIIKNNLNLFRSLLGIHAFALHEKMGSPPNELIKLVLDNGGIRIFVNQDRTVYFQLSAETYAKWGKQKIMKYEFHKKIVMVIDVDAPYKGWRSGVRVSLK